MRIEDVAEEHASWETLATEYRVYFWTQLAEGRSPAAPLWQCEPRRIVDAPNVADVLAWARENTAGRTFTVYVEVPQAAAAPPGLVRIFGIDPTAPAET